MPWARSCRGAGPCWHVLARWIAYVPRGKAQNSAGVSYAYNLHGILGNNWPSDCQLNANVSRHIESTSARWFHYNIVSAHFNYFCSDPLTRFPRERITDYSIINHHSRKGKTYMNTWTVYDSKGNMVAWGILSRRDAESVFPPGMAAEYKVICDGARIRTDRDGNAFITRAED